MDKSLGNNYSNKFIGLVTLLLGIHEKNRPDFIQLEEMMKKRNPEERGKASTRLFDMLFSSTAVVALFPFMLPIMAGLKLTGEHYIFYTQKRVGKGEKEFSLLKFATMLKDSPNLPGGLFTLENDPRILPMGKFLRKTKINELPQLLNILKGDMSLVGTRPPTGDEWEKYKYHHRARLATRPGLTGMWQVSGRSDITDFEEIVALDTAYITNWTLGLDIQILAKTIGVVLSGQGSK